MHGKYNILLIQVLLLTTFVYQLAQGQTSGVLDTSFHGNGWVVSTFSSLDSLYGMALQPDGKMVTIGQAEGQTGNGNFGFARFNPDGSLDTAFGDHGRATPLIGSFGVGRAIALQADRRIVGAGVSGSGFDARFAVVRLNSDGSLDSTFNGTGSKILTEQSGVAYSVLAQNDGKIVLVGVTEGIANFVAVRLNADGSYDTSFNGTGISRISVGNGFVATSYKFVGVLQHDGKIVVGGTVNIFHDPSNTYPLGLVRFMQDGSQDLSFGDGGRTVIELTAPVFHVGGLSQQSDGKIIVAGVTSGFFSGSDFAALRFSPDGSIDSSFGDQGKVITSTSDGGEEVNALAIDGQGKIVAAGCREDVPNSFSKHHTFVQYDPSGALDPSFGNGGILRETTSVQNDCAQSILIDPQRGIRAGGIRNEANGEFSVLGLNSDGTRDTSFSTDGLVSVYVGVHGFESEGANALAVQRNGKIVALVSDSTLGNVFALVRYDSDGTLDQTFDADGKVVLLAPSGSGTQGSGSANAIAIQPDDKIVAAGQATNRGASRRDIVLMRILQDGSPDPSFGNNGKVVTQAPQSFVDVRSLAIQPDGKMVVAGELNPGGSSSSFIVVRYRPDGTLDPAFGVAGIVTAQFQLRDGAYSVAIQNDGRVVVSGASSPGGGGFPSGAVMRLNTDGSLDNSFGQGGKVRLAVRFLSSAIQSDGKILLLTDVQGFSVGRLNTDGSLDESFGDFGFTNTQIGVSSKATSIILQGDGKTLSVGYSKATQLGYDDFTIIRYDNNGRLDTSFNGNGIVVTAISPLVDQAYAAAMQPDGKIVVGGKSFSNATMDDIAVARYFSGYSPARGTFFDFDGDGKADVSIFRPLVGQWYYQRSLNGVVNGFQFGTSSDKPVPADFTGDGKTDIAFFRASSNEWFVLRSDDSTFFAFPFGAAGDIPVPADYDGDGKADAAVYRPSAQTWFILRSTGGVLSVPFGLSSDIPVPADYDGDGKADVGIYRPDLGQWWNLRSSNNQVFAATFGSPTDKPVVGDYTGDGKADVAFYRPSEGSWYVLRSEDFTYYAFPFGNSTDKPAPADYDGDGKYDAAIFRPSDTNWYIARSSGGVTIQQFGAADDVPLPGALVP